MCNNNRFERYLISDSFCSSRSVKSPWTKAIVVADSIAHTRCPVLGHSLESPGIYVDLHPISLPRAANDNLPAQFLWPNDSKWPVVARDDCTPGIDRKATSMTGRYAALDLSV